MAEQLSNNASSTPARRENIYIPDSGSNRKHWISPDGVNWVLLASTHTATFITADQVGFFVDSQSGASARFDMIVDLLFWKETTDTTPPIYVAHTDLIEIVGGAADRVFQFIGI